MQQRIKWQQYANAEVPQNEKVDIVIVVDMLLTGFDSKFLNTLYVDKKLKHHGLIQAFSRTNRTLNDTKPHGNIIDYRSQRANVDTAIELFSGEKDKTKPIMWLVDPAPKVIKALNEKVDDFKQFIQKEQVSYDADGVANLKGDTAKSEFINKFKDIKRLHVKLGQYTDLTNDEKQQIESTISTEQLQSFTGAYLSIANDFKKRRDTDDEDSEITNNTDFEEILFTSVVIDFDYIMQLISDHTAKTPEEKKVSRQKLLDILKQDAQFNENDHNLIELFIDSLPNNTKYDTEELKNRFDEFAGEKQKQQIDDIAEKYNLDTDALHTLIDNIADYRRIDNDALFDLMEPLGFGWQQRTKTELALVQDIMPILYDRTKNKPIDGLETYEQG